MSYAILSFDVDGTLTRQGEVLKQRAWDIVGEGCTLKFRKTLTVYRERYSGGGGSRYDIIRATLNAIGVRAADIEQEIEKIAQAYQAAVMSLLRYDLRTETRPILELLKTRYKLYINSATEEGGLRHFLLEVGLAQFFEGIYGYPRDGSRKKADNLRLICEVEGVDPKQLVHVGDSENDMVAARDIGCFFIGVANNDNRWISGEESFMVIGSLSELPDVLNSVP